MTQLTDKAFAVEVPDECSMPNVWNNQLCSGALVLFPLPAGDWAALFSTKDCNEEDARKVVPVIRNYHPETLLDEIFAEVSVDTHLASLASLLRSKGLDTDKNYALIEKKNH